MFICVTAVFGSVVLSQLALACLPLLCFTFLLPLLPLTVQEAAVNRCCCSTHRSYVKPNVIRKGRLCFWMWLCGFILLLFSDGSRVDAESISTKALHTKRHSDGGGASPASEILPAFFQTLLKWCSLGGPVSSTQTVSSEWAGGCGPCLQLDGARAPNLDQSVSGPQLGSCRTHESSEVYPVNY